MWVAVVSFKSKSTFGSRTGRTGEIPRQSCRHPHARNQSAQRTKSRGWVEESRVTWPEADQLFASRDVTPFESKTSDGCQGELGLHPSSYSAIGTSPRW